MKIVLPTGEEIGFDTLRQSIVLGKRAGWASGVKPTKLPDGTKHYENRHGDFLYTDDFEGEQNFLGRERIVHVPTNVRLWGMNYSDVFCVPIRGNYHKSFYTPRDPNITTEMMTDLKNETFNFLKEMLMEVPVEHPFRGPLTWGDINRTTYSKSGLSIRLSYFNMVEKCDSEPLREFMGRESIIATLSKAGENYLFPVFALDYHGRVLVPDSYLSK